MARPVVHCLQHSERVRPVTVASWADAREVDLHVVRVDLEPLPAPSDVDALVVLGGAMNTDQADLHPWLDAEREFLRRAVEAGTTRILGICLGSQLLAEVLGGEVGRAEVPEVGWQRIELTAEGRRSPVFGALPEAFDAFQWHGDQWSLPPGAMLCATSAGCRFQAFSWGELVHAVQFHPEFTWERTRELAATTTDQLGTSRFVQEPAQFLADPGRFDGLRAACMTLLDRALLDEDPPA